MSRPFGSDHALAVARRICSVDASWEICALEAVPPNAVRIRLGVPRILKRGPNKGHKTFRDSKERREIIVTYEEIERELGAYEARTGECGDCLGSGQVFAAWAKRTGRESKACGRCAGTGKPLVIIMNQGDA